MGVDESVKHCYENFGGGGMVRTCQLRNVTGKKLNFLPLSYRNIILIQKRAIYFFSKYRENAPL